MLFDPINNHLTGNYEPSPVGEGGPPLVVDEVLAIPKAFKFLVQSL